MSIVTGREYFMSSIHMCGLSSKVLLRDQIARRVESKLSGRALGQTDWFDI
jgi:hypothetical protein